MICMSHGEMHCIIWYNRTLHKDFSSVNLILFVFASLTHLQHDSDSNKVIVCRVMMLIIIVMDLMTSPVLEEK